MADLLCPEVHEAACSAAPSNVSGELEGVMMLELVEGATN